MRKKKDKMSFHGGFVTPVKHLRCSSEGLFAGSHARRKRRKGEKEALNESQRADGNMFNQICFKVLAPPHWIGAPLELLWQYQQPKWETMQRMRTNTFMN